MGASGWSYFVPYQPDINKALQELRQKVFQEGDYFKPAEWQKRLYEHKIISEQELNNALDELALVPEPQTIEELIEQRGEEGTHSIIDIDRVSSLPDFGAAVPLPLEEYIEIFGTDKPTREMIEEKVEDIEEYTDMPMVGVYIIVYNTNSPAEIYFSGFSGD
jgi:hypothetical protein